MPWALGANPPGYDPRTVRRIQRPMGPLDVTAFAADFAGALDAAIDDDTIATVIGATIARNDDATDSFGLAAPLALNADATRVIVWLGGGTSGYEYLVSVRVASVAGQDLTRSFIVPVLGR